MSAVWPCPNLVSSSLRFSDSLFVTFLTSSMPPAVLHSLRSFLPVLVSLVSLSFLGPSVTHSVPSDVPAARGDEWRTEGRNERDKGKACGDSGHEWETKETERDRYHSLPHAFHLLTVLFTYGSNRDRRERYDRGWKGMGRRECKTEPHVVSLSLRSVLHSPLFVHFTSFPPAKPAPRARETRWRTTVASDEAS